MAGASTSSSPSVEVPALGEPQLDAWVRTSPRPNTDPAVSFYLHGFTEDDPDVRLVWRADIAGAMVEADLLDAIERKPPMAEETLEVSLRAAAKGLAAAQRCGRTGDGRALARGERRRGGCC